MRSIIREQFFRLGEDSTILNEAGQPIFEVDGKVLSLHDRLIVRDLAGNEVANVHRQLFTLTPTYKISRGGETLATFRNIVSKQWFSLTETYGVDIAPSQDDPLILACVLALDLAEDREHLHDH